MSLYEELREADAALGIEDLSEAAASLNAQTVTIVNQPFHWIAAKKVARNSATGDWARIVARARQTPSLPPASVMDMAILTAINAVESADDDMIDPQSEVWQGGLQALHGIGDVSPETFAALQSLSTVVVPRWPVTIDAGMIQTARAQP